MEKLQLPFNVKMMDEKESSEFIDKVNNGDLELLIEVRDEKNNLKGFSTALSVNKKYELLKRKLNTLEYISKKVSNRHFYGKKDIKYDLEILLKSMRRILDVKDFVIEDNKDIQGVLNELGSYTEAEAKENSISNSITYRTL